MDRTFPIVIGTSSRPDCLVVVALVCTSVVGGIDFVAMIFSNFELLSFWVANAG